jgi:perosamine synthetase
VKRLRRRLWKVEQIGTRSREIAEFYRMNIDSDRVIHPKSPDGSDCVYARYPLLVQGKQELLAKAKKANVELAEWYSTPIHPVSSDQGAAIGYEAQSCPQAECRSREIVSLPTHGRVGRRYLEKAAQFFASL